MEQIVAFMLLVSCSDDLSSCKEIPAPTVSYQTARACHAEMPKHLANHATNHIILGTCVTVDASAFYSDATLVWDISKSGKLSAELVTANQDVIAYARPPAEKSTLR